MVENEDLFSDGRAVRFGFFTSRMLIFTAWTFLFSFLVFPVSWIASAVLFLCAVGQVIVRYRYRVRAVDGILEVRNLFSLHRFDTSGDSLELRFPADEGSKYHCRMNRGMRVKDSSTDWVFVGATRVDCGSLKTWFERISELEEAVVTRCSAASVTHDRA